MARIVNTISNTSLSCKVTTGSSINNIKIGDTVTNLKYLDGEDVKSITGKVKDITFVCKKVTRVNVTKPVDYVIKDITVGSIVIDASKKYESNVVTILSSALCDAAGTKATVVADIGVSLTMEYSDNTSETVDIAVGDVFKDCRIMTTPKKEDITGTYSVVALRYNTSSTAPSVYGLYLRPIGGGKAIAVLFDNFISIEKGESVAVSSSVSLVEIANALKNSETGEVFASLGTEVSVPKNSSGQIVTTMINAGKTLNLDLNGHKITNAAYALYVNGGTLNISDTTGNGAIICTDGNSHAYPAVYVNSGVCNMDSGVIDTTQAVTDEGKENWLYGVVCSKDGVFNMTGGTMKIQGAAGISITNGTANGEGAKFTIGGDAVITSVANASVYLADNKSVVVKDNAVLNGGMVLRMGDISVEDNAVINSHSDPEKVYPLGQQVVLSGVGAPSAAILALTGIYGSALGNDMNISIAKTAKLNGKIDDAIDIATINTKYDQKVNIDIESSSSVIGVSSKFRVYDHDELAALATAEGKSLGAEATTTTLTINMDGSQVYPVTE